MAAGAAGQRGLLIGGADRAAGTGRTEKDLNPYTGEVFATVAAAAPEDVTAAVDAAAAAFPGWAATDVGTRRKIFLRAADLLEQRTEDAVALMAGEVGGTRPWAMFNAGLAADVLR